MTDYDLELDRIIKEVKKSGAKRVGLQFPDGLKDRALAAAAAIESSTKAKAIIMADPTYGGCDMKSAAAEKLGFDLLVHFGHTRF